MQLSKQEDGGTLPWLDGYIGKCSSPLVYNILTSLQEKTDTNLPILHKKIIVERCALSRRVDSNQENESIFLADCGDPALEGTSTLPASETLKHQSSRIMLFQELIDFYRREVS